MVFLNDDPHSVFQLMCPDTVIPILRYSGSAKDDDDREQ